MHTNPQDDKNKKQITITQYDSKIYFSNLKTFQEKFKKLSAQFSHSDQKEYYIVSVKFIGQWRDFCNTQDLTRTLPFPMNHNLYEDNSSLKLNLVEGADYQIVNKQIYELFKPFNDKTNKNKRTAVTIGRQKKVPIYISGFTYIYFDEELLKKIDLKKMPFEQLRIQKIQESEEQTFEQLLKSIRQKQKISKGCQCRLWINQKDLTPKKLHTLVKQQLKPCSVASYVVKGIGRRIDQLDAKICDIILQEGDYFIFECVESSRSKFFFMKDDQGRCEGCHHFGKLDFPCGCNKVRYCSDACLQKDKHFHMRHCSFAEQMELNKKIEMTITKNSKLGLVGLNNLGNTCFMNSCLQCLSNTAPLREYFLKSYFQEQINKDNPIGTKGKLVKNYAKFIKGLWCDQNDTFAPYNVKNAVSDINPMFSGFAQHDSQQFFSFIVDGLHEDLNRVLKKPYVPSVQEKGKNQQQLARQSWSAHIKRNQSIIVDTMAGQYKSKVTCPDCKHHSTTFDPYITVTLPIPQKVQTVTDVFFVYSNMNTKTKRAWFKYTKPDANQWVRQAAKAGGVDQNSWKLYVVSIYQGLYKFGRDSMSQIAHKVQNDSKNMFMFELSKQQLEIPQQKRVQFVGRYSKKSYDYQNAWFKMPFIFDKTNLKGLDIYIRMLKFLYNQAYDDSKKRSFFGGKSYQDYQKQMLKLRPFDLFLRFNKKFQRGYQRVQLKFEKDFPIQDQMQILAQLKQKNIDLYDCQLDARFKKEMLSKFSFERLKQFDTIGKQPKAARSQDATVELDQCFSSFNQPETLQAGNQWYCPNCKQHKLATKQLSIYRAPKVLILHLKRFKQKGTYRKEKNESKVIFPSQLDMSKHLINHKPMTGYKEEVSIDYIEPIPTGLKNQPIDINSKPIYDLYAVSNHYGGLGGGHYTAYAKNKGQWYDFNDSHVSKTSADSICGSGAYLLFYERRN